MIAYGSIFFPLNQIELLFLFFWQKLPKIQCFWNEFTLNIHFIIAHKLCVPGSLSPEIETVISISISFSMLLRSRKTYRNYKTICGFFPMCFYFHHQNFSDLSWLCEENNNNTHFDSSTAETPNIFCILCNLSKGKAKFA